MPLLNLIGLVTSMHSIPPKDLCLVHLRSEAGLGGTQAVLVPAVAAGISGHSLHSPLVHWPMRLLSWGDIALLSHRRVDQAAVGEARSSAACYKAKERADTVDVDAGDRLVAIEASADGVRGIDTARIQKERPLLDERGSRTEDIDDLGK